MLTDIIQVPGAGEDDPDSWFYSTDEVNKQGRALNVPVVCV